MTIPACSRLLEADTLMGDFAASGVRPKVSLITIYIVLWQDLDVQYECHGRQTQCAGRCKAKTSGWLKLYCIHLAKANFSLGTIVNLPTCGGTSVAMYCSCSPCDGTAAWWSKNY